MTLTADPPVERPGDWLPVASEPRLPGWRLAARLAWREVVRRKARTALVVLLIATPAAAMTLAAAVYRTNADSERLATVRGPADVVIDGQFAGADTLDGRSGMPTEAELAEAGVPEGSDVIGYLMMHAMVTPAEPPRESTVSVGDRLWVTFSDAPVGDPKWASLVQVVDGRAPTEDGEMLVGPDVATALGVEVGDSVSLERPSGTWTVVGIGRWTSDYWRQLMIVPGFDHDRVSPAERTYEVLLDLPEGTPRDEVAGTADRLGGTVAGELPFWERTDDPAELTLGWVLGAMAFLVFGIVVAAAFATSARKQLLTVGQLSANGASSRLVTRVLSWQGLWSGLLGGTVGAVLALASLPLLRETAQVRLFHSGVGWTVRPFDVVVVIATATGAGLLAALVPSRSLARTSVLSALAGRRPVKDVPRWLLPLGGGLLLGGTGLMTLALLAGRDHTDSTPFAIAAVLGGGAIAVGTCCVSPWVVQHFARLAPHVPLAGRLALRSLARSRGRSAAVISAIAVTVGLATAAVGAVEYAINDRLDGDGYLPRDTVVLRLEHERLVGALSPEQLAAFEEHAVDGLWPEFTVDIPPLSDVEVPDDVVDWIDEHLPGARIDPVEFAVAPGGEVTVTEGFWEGEGELVAVASDTTFRAGSWPDSAREQFEDVGWAELVPAVDETAATWPDEPWSPLTALAPPETIAAEGAPWGGMFATLIERDMAEQAGYDVVTLGAVITTPEPLTAEQRDQLSELYELLNPDVYHGPNSPFIEPGDEPAPDAATVPTAGPFEYWFVDYQWVDATSERDLWIARGLALAAAVVLTGIVVAIGLALTAADNKAERDVFAVVGARPSSLRRMAAWNAATMSLIGIAIGVPVGFLPAWFVVGATKESGRSLPFPWQFVGALVAIVPAVMLLTAWAGSAVAARWAGQPTPRRAD